MVATYPADGDGLECDSASAPECGVPIDAAIELRFDRWLLPATAVRQSVLLYSTTPDSAILLQPEYDVVERVVAFRRPSGGSLERGILYTLEVVLPDAGDPESFGFRSFDGAPLEPGPVPLTVTFRTATADPSPAPPPPPGCEVALDRLRSCVGASCHGAPGRMGLTLEGAAGVADAVGRAAHQTELGAVAGATNEAPRRFGVQMPLIDPGRPDNSYLVYKLLARGESWAPAGGAECESGRRVPIAQGGPAGECLAGPGAELERARAWFLRGEAMPPASLPEPRPDRPVRREHLTDLIAWIRSGASLDGCD